MSYRSKNRGALLGIILLEILIYQSVYGMSSELKLPSTWRTLQPILTSRVYQTTPKMKLSKEEVNSFAKFLNNLTHNPHQICDF